MKNNIHHKHFTRGSGMFWRWALNRRGYATSNTGLLERLGIPSWTTTFTISVLCDDLYRALIYGSNVTWPLFFFRRFRKISKNDHQLLHVRLWVRMQQPGPHWMDFHEIYVRAFRKKKNCPKNFQVSLKSDKNNGSYTCRLMYIYNTSLSSS